MLPISYENQIPHFPPFPAPVKHPFAVPCPCDYTANGQEIGDSKKHHGESHI